MAICSGRSENQIDDKILAIGFDAIVSAAGVSVSADGKKIFNATIEPKDYRHLQNALKDIVPRYAVQTDEKVYLSLETLIEMDRYAARVFGEDTSEEKSVEEYIQNAKKSIGVVEITDDPGSVENPQKMFYHSAKAPVEEVEAALGDHFTVQQLSFGPPNPYAGEITKRGVEKSTGMDALMKYYGLTEADAIAIGDGPNDMDMITYANLGICMGNGRDELKAIEDFVTASADADGIYKALEHFDLL